MGASAGHGFTPGEFKRRTLEKVRGLRCPIHRQTPRLTFRGRTPQDVTVRMRACCDALMAVANRRIAGLDG